MRHDQLERLLRFARRTGDRLIITDPKGDEPIVIMGLDQYESLIDLTMGLDEDYVDEGEFLLEDPAETPLTQEVPVEEAREERDPALEVIEAPPQVPQPTPAMASEEQFYLEPL